ncbi:hypothetical protein HORIV_15190 [Vreelandella olivaria]|uniref:DUF112 domain-containing protein n=1 Tax=Vreelandella olivaria TaxID=390919 RepID=A0ABM7GFE2_9GAMM|nr:hypothetical protein HORIV_15190 [Halomonas olivaria]
MVGAYAINYGIMFDVWTLLIFGVLGYLVQKIGLEVAPLIIGFILGSQAEVYFVKSLESFGTYSIFFHQKPHCHGAVGVDCRLANVRGRYGLQIPRQAKMELTQVTGSTRTASGKGHDTDND